MDGSTYHSDFLAYPLRLSLCPVVFQWCILETRLCTCICPYTRIILIDTFCITNASFYHNIIDTSPQMITLKKDPSKNPRKWIQAPEFIPVHIFCIVLFTHYSSHFMHRFDLLSVSYTNKLLL